MISETMEMSGGKVAEPVMAERQLRPTEGTMVGELRQVRVEEIEVGYNPRAVFDEGKLAELKASIAAIGITQPLILRVVPVKYKLREPDLIGGVWELVEIATGHVDQYASEKLARAEYEELQPLPYLLVAGERRLRAASELGLATVPAVCREMSDAEVAAVQDVENLVRENLSALEEGENIAKRIEDLTAKGTGRGEAVAELMRVYGKGQAWVYQRMALAKVPPVVRAALVAGKIEMSVADLLARIPVAKLQQEALKAILEGGEEDPEVKPGGETDWEKRTPRPLSFREAQALVYRRFMLDLKNAPFDWENAGLVPAAGSCRDCPKRSGNARELYPEVKSPQICTDPQCWALKDQANTRGAIALLQAEGKRVLSVEETAKVFNKEGYMISRDEYVRAVEFKSGEEIGELVKRIPKGERPKPVIALVDNQQVELFVKKEVDDLFRKHELGVGTRPPGEKEGKEEKEIAARLEKAVREAVVARAKTITTGEFDRLLVRHLARSYGSMSAERLVTPGLAEKLRDQSMAGIFEGEYGDPLAVFLDVMQARLYWGSLADDCAEWFGVDLDAVEKAVRAERKKELADAKGKKKK